MDALSRRPNQEKFHNLTVPLVLDVRTIGFQVDADPHLVCIKNDLAAYSKSWPKYSLKQRHLLYQGRLVLP